MINQIKPFELPIKVEVFICTGREEKQYLLLKRIPEDGGFWQPITGTLESEDSIKDCILREIKEEASLIPGDGDMLSDVLHTFTWKKGETVITEYVFMLLLENPTTIVLSNEHSDYCWVDYEEAISLLEKQNNINALNIVNKLNFLN